MKRSFYPLIPLLRALVGALALGLVPMGLSAAPPDQAGRPTVQIIKPSDGSIQPMGRIWVEADSKPASGIDHVEMYLDSNASPTFSILPGPIGKTIFQPNITTSGPHTIRVRAVSLRGEAGEASISINTGASAGCRNDARFVQHITYPDGSYVSPNTPFVKTWAVQNTGDCTWLQGYTLIRTGGPTFGAPASIDVDYTRPGDTATLSVNLFAPAQFGSYTSQWQLRSPNGGLKFGPLLYARFNVSSTGCSGAPEISEFFASPRTITRGGSSRLNWEVINADRVLLNASFGNQQVADSGNELVSPQVTTTYTLTAYCGGQPTSENEVVRVANPPTPVPQNRVDPLQSRRATNRALYVTARYFYNNEIPQGQIQVRITNWKGDEVGLVREGAIPGSEQTRELYVEIQDGIQNAVSMQGCLVRDELPFACSASKLVQK